MRTLLAGSAVLITVCLPAVPAEASSEASSPGDFGQHVMTCVESTGFDGGHNPGLHMGFAGWDPDHEC